ncbi:hypothetical protein [Planctomycetes bacterium Pan216]|uniref:hypothetical protein n=1 Tax=Kolteria novifilia TaxID=2527975 RepID=UPI0011A1902F
MIARLLTPHRRCSALLLMLPLAVVLAAGCGDGRPQRFPVSGTVVVDGKPLTKGVVRFVPDGSRPATGKVLEDGRFAMTTFGGADGVMPGKHRVEIFAIEQLGPNKRQWLVPKKYSSYTTSGLEYTIDEPADDLTIELSWDGKEPLLEVFEDEGI